MDSIPVNELSFYLRRTNLDDARAKAAKLGVELTTQELLLAELARDAYYQTHDSPWPGAVLEMPVGYLRWASAMRDAYVRVTLTAPATDWAVVGVADRTDGPNPSFYSFAEPSPWTKELMDGIDFLRCDECGCRQHRKQAWIIRRGAEIRQIGGSCVSKLDLTKKLADMLAGFKSFFKEMAEDYGDDWEGGLGGHMIGNYHWVLCLMKAWIGKEGFLGRARGQEIAKMPTVELVQRSMNRLSPESRMPAAREGWQLFLAGEGPAIEADLRAFLESQGDDKEIIRNASAALANRSWRGMGVVAWAVSAALAWKAQKAQAAPKYYEAQELTAEQVATMSNITVHQLAQALGLEGLKKLGQAPGKKKLARMLPGIWTVTGRASWDSDFGTQHLVVLTREDGARVKWITGSLPDRKGGINNGDRFLVLAATVGENEMHAQRGPHTRISRVTLAELITA